MQALKGKVALVTGASRGAGKGIALELIEAGATVYITGRSVEGRAAAGAGARRRLHAGPGEAGDAALPGARPCAPAGAGPGAGRRAGQAGGRRQPRPPRRDWLRLALSAEPKVGYWGGAAGL